MSDYYRMMEIMNTRPDSMRGVVLALMHERKGRWVYAQELAEIIGTTPTLGARGGEKCQAKHVIAKMTAGFLEARARERNCDFRLVIDPGFERMALVPKREENAWRKEHKAWYVSDFSNNKDWRQHRGR